MPDIDQPSTILAHIRDLIAQAYRQGYENGVIAEEDDIALHGDDLDAHVWEWIGDQRWQQP